MNVLTKQENWRLVTSGAYGNRLRHWRSLNELQADGFGGPVSIRYLGAGGGPCLFDVKAEDVEDEVLKLRSAGWSEKLLCFNEGAPDRSIIIQGELYNTIPYHARVSYEKVKMREALRRDFTDLSGWVALEAFRTKMSPSSRDDLEELLKSYPEHVLEISVYGRMLGDCPGRNSLIWEVRKY